MKDKTCSQTNSHPSRQTQTSGELRWCLCVGGEGEGGVVGFRFVVVVVVVVTIVIKNYHNND